MQIPKKIKLNSTEQCLVLTYADGVCWQLPAEFLRVHSPSAEVQGHGRPILQWGKQHVRLTGVEPAGNYALKLIFDDGHDSGLFSWDYLYHLGLNQEQLWQEYLDKLTAEGKFRDPDQSAIRLL